MQSVFSMQARVSKIMWSLLGFAISPKKICNKILILSWIPLAFACESRISRK
ncbi:hypothetical protein Hanom_Chr03g00238131 [Helianthus anomalus]